MALFSNFPYSNTEEINLDYTLNKLNELYTRGENLYAELQSWKTATDEEHEAWKSDLLSDINEWQNSVTHSLEEWKSLVDSNVANAINSLSNQITAELAQAKTDLRNEVADLASAAAASASDAAASQSAAAQSAQSAINSAGAAAASAAEIAESAEQIETNTNDITDLKSANKNNNVFLNAPNNLINYGYDTDANLEPENVSTPTGIGIKRFGDNIVLNTVTTNSGARIKLNGDVVRTGYSGAEANAVVDAWQGITLTRLHIYRITLTYISGSSSSAVPAISVYEQGSHSTIGNGGADGNNYVREFLYVDNPVNIVLVAWQNSSYTNYKCTVTIEDVSKTFHDAYKNLTDAYNADAKAINYGYLDMYGSLPTAGNITGACMGFEQSGIMIRLNGTNTAADYIKIKLTIPVRTITNSTVDSWTGIDLQVGHRYKVISTFLGGSATWASYSAGSAVPIGVYRNGTHSNFGIANFNAKGQWIGTFTAVDQNFTFAAVIERNATFKDAVYSVEIYDVTDIDPDYEFLSTAQTVRLFSTDAGVGAIGQSMVFVDGIIYAYSYSPEKIWKIDLINDTLSTYNLNLGHGNGMVYYNGFLYVCGMASDGVIYKVDPNDMTVAESIVYRGNGNTPVITSGIAYNYDTGKFVLKVSGGFHIVSTSFVYESSITRKYISGATGQGISCDKDYIYVIEYNPNDIHIYDYNGNYHGKVKIDIADEPENIYNDGNGGWYMISNVGEYSTTDGFYIDSVRFYKDMSLSNISAVAKLFGNLNY